MGSQPGLSDAEREVLRALWDQGQGAVREIRNVLAERGRKWAYTTVATLLQRLQAKQYVTSDASVLPTSIVRPSRVRSCSTAGSRMRRPSSAMDRRRRCLLALVQGNRFSSEELARFRHLLDAAGSELKSRKPKA